MDTEDKKLILLICLAYFDEALLQMINQPDFCSKDSTTQLKIRQTQQRIQTLLAKEEAKIMLSTEEFPEINMNIYH